jgi:polygalacturonase
MTRTPAKKSVILTKSESPYRLFLLLLLLLLTATAQAAPINVKQFGATGDGKTLDTSSIQKAIDTAAIKGGTVQVPAGTYLSGSLFVRSGVTLNIERGATILGSQRLEDYPIMPTRIAGIEMSWPAALINVYSQHDAAITGEGTVDGDGKIFWDSYWALRKTYEPKGLRWASDYDAKRPRLIQIFNSSNVSLSKLLLRRAGFWTVHICYSHDIQVDGVTIRNNEDGHGPSTDGIDIDSSRKILVAHADIAVNDDALCLKAGRDSDGLRVNRPTEDVVLRDSIVREGAAGVTFGSETSGGFRNIEAYGITVLKPVPVGILFKSAHTRGGFAEHLNLHHFTLKDVQVAVRFTMNWNPSYSYAAIPREIHDYPPYWTVLSTPVPAEKGMAHVSDVRISNIQGTAKTAFEVDAYTQAPLVHFTFSDIDLHVQTAGHIADASDWTFTNVTLTVADGTKVALTDSRNVTGIETVAAARKPEPKPGTFADQDKK